MFTCSIIFKPFKHWIRGKTNYKGVRQNYFSDFTCVQFVICLCTKSSQHDLLEALLLCCMMLSSRCCSILTGSCILSVCLVSLLTITHKHKAAPLLQSRESETWPDGGWAVEGQVHLRLRFPPWHRGEDVCDWADVCSGANEHDNHRLHAHLLQVQQRFNAPWSAFWCNSVLMQHAALY